MTIKQKAVAFKQVAEEASFQLACSKEFTGWIVSIIKAIQLDQEHEDGRNIQGLADLGQYLAETHLATVESACDAIDSSLNRSEGAQ